MGLCCNVGSLSHIKTFSNLILIIATVEYNSLLTRLECFDVCFGFVSVYFGVEEWRTSGNVVSFWQGRLNREEAVNQWWRHGQIIDYIVLQYILSVVFFWVLPCTEYSSFFFFFYKLIWVYWFVFSLILSTNTISIYSLGNRKCVCEPVLLSTHLQKAVQTDTVVFMPYMSVNISIKLRIQCTKSHPACWKDPFF